LPTFSNGTALYNPTTLLISLDGFRPSYLTTHAHLVPHLLALGNSSLGLRAESMQPRFPTQTFPNHWSLMTGLNPESHGIVANEFWDPVMKKEFVYTKHDQSWDAAWWWGEPLWSVAERGGRRTANIMW
jgi:predicted AlkP superfamily pyrophosphatase or phosphodiesterase